MDGFIEWVTQGAQPDLDWTYALVTLVFRFFAVFVVLWLIQAAMQVAAYLIRRSEGGGGTATAGDSTNGPGTRSASARREASGPEEIDGVDPLIAAAIGLALELEAQPEAARIPAERGTSAWSAAGRVRALRNPPR